MDGSVFRILLNGFSDTENIDTLFHIWVNIVDMNCYASYVISALLCVTLDKQILIYRWVFILDITKRVVSVTESTLEGGRGIGLPHSYAFDGV